MKKHVIRERSLLMNRTLYVKPNGIVFVCADAFSTKKKFTYSEIQCVLVNEDKTSLSFQVGTEVFSIKIKAKRTKDREATTAFVVNVRETQAGQ